MSDTTKEVFIRRPEVCNEFVLILLETNKKSLSFPKSIRREVQLEKRDDIGDLLEMVEFTGDEADYITNKELQDKLQAAENSLSTNKAGRILRSKGVRSSTIVRSSLGDVNSRKHKYCGFESFAKVERGLGHS